MTDQTKEQLRVEFNKIDSDGNGSLSIEELTRFSTTVSPKISDKDIQKIFKHMDIDGNGKITFEEFFEWWENKENKILPLLYIKQSIQKSLAKAQESLSQAKSGASTEGDSLQQFKVSFKVGDSPCKSEVAFKLSTHLKSLVLSKSVRAALGLDENEPSLVLKFKVSKDQQEAKRILTDLIEQGKEILECVLPRQYSELILKIIGIKVEVFESDSLLVSISSTHPMVNEIKKQYSKLVDHLNVGDQSAAIDFSAQNSLDFKELLDTPKPNINKQFVEGFNLNLNIQASKILLRNLRKIYFNKVIKQHDQGENLSSKRKAQRFFAIIGCLLNGISISAQAKDLSEMFESQQMPPQMIDKIFSEIRSKANPQAMISSIPILQDFIDFFLNHLQSEIGVLLIVPGILAEIKLKTQNFSLVYQKIFNP